MPRITKSNSNRLTLVEPLINSSKADYYCRKCILYGVFRRNEHIVTTSWDGGADLSSPGPANNGEEVANSDAVKKFLTRLPRRWSTGRNLLSLGQELKRR